MLPYYADLLRRPVMIEDDSTFRIAFFGVPVAIWPHAIVIAVLVCWAYWSIFEGSSWALRDWLIAVSVSLLGMFLSLAYATFTLRLREEW